MARQHLLPTCVNTLSFTYLKRKSCTFSMMSLRLGHIQTKCTASPFPGCKRGSTLGRSDTNFPLLGSISQENLRHNGDAPDCDSAQPNRAGLLTLGRNIGGGMIRCPSTLHSNRKRPAAAKPCPSSTEFSLHRPRFLQCPAQAVVLLCREQVLVLRQEDLRISPQTAWTDLQHLALCRA